MSYRFKGIMILAAAVFMLSLANPCTAENASGDSKASEKGDYVAVVNGVKIPKKDLERKVELIKARYASQGMPVEGQRLARLKETILDNLIEKELLFQESQAQGIEVDPKKIQKELDNLKGRFKSEADFQKKIASMNYSEDLLKKQIKENLAIRKLIDEKIASKISVSDEEIKDYYENNQDEFKNPEKVHARHILVKSQQDASDEKKAEARKKIEEVQKKLEQGNDFSELAKEYSEGPSSKKGGDLGYFSHGQMVEKFDKAAFALEPGETSDIVETRFGYHIIKVEDKKSESMKSLDKVRDSIRENLRNEKLMQELEPYIASLKKKYPVEKNLPETGGDKQQ